MATTGLALLPAVRKAQRTCPPPETKSEMKQRSVPILLVALVPLLVIAACGTKTPGGFAPGQPEAGPTPTVDGAVATVDSGTPNIGTFDSSTNPVTAVDSGEWVEQPDGAWAFKGDAGGWLLESDGGWLYAGDSGWVLEPDGGWLYTGEDRRAHV